MIATKDSEIAAEQSGVDTVRIKLMAFMIGAVYAGLAGCLYASSIRFISPDSFSGTQAVLLMTMLIIGGMGSIPGCIIGALVLTLLPEALRFLGQWYLVLYGLGVICVIVLAPGGLASFLASETARGHGTMTTAPIISARGVTRRFGGLVALDGVDLDVPRGIVQAVIGPNGSGKTTLLNALSGASHADAGSIRLDGEEIFRLRPHKIARIGLARTFQNIRLFANLSVLENVKVAAACRTPTPLFSIVTSASRQRQNEDEIEHSAREALRLVGLEARAGDRANQLPYAQQRLLEIARALASKPQRPAAG